MTSRLLRPALKTLRGTPSTLLPTAARQFTTSLPRMTIHNLTSMPQYQEAIHSHPVVIIDAYATWCGPCKAIAPLVAKWAQDPEFKDKTYFAKFDVDELPELAEALEVRAMPTFIFFKDGERVDEFMGANPPGLLAVLKKYNPGEEAEAEKAKTPEKEIEE